MDGLRISEVAGRAGVTTSAVRYYERIGLLPEPARTHSGYRSYSAAIEARLLFITRAKRMGLALDEIAELVAIWDGSNCGAAKGRIEALLARKRADLRRQIRELRAFEQQLAGVAATLKESPTPVACDPDLACCAPAVDFVEIGRMSVSSPAVSRAGVPIACTLAPDERPQREADLSALLAVARRAERDARGLRVWFTWAPATEDRLVHVSSAESQCCAFLEFTVDRDGDDVMWKITAPSDEAAVSLDEFAAFLPPESFVATGASA